ncbi:hypothetical protein VNI00_018669 [Paramarasmius palmivorus]|uniref:DUF6535 domain-containing protein n=1 Tax=Paramarasmius palmivorus TaxID=297713 RepID=A0AAW0AUF5_9AGAR
MSTNAGGTRSSPEENLTGDAVRVHHGVAVPKKIRGTKPFASASNEEPMKTSREDIDTLIVFGTIFSILITAFFIGSYQKLKEDRASPVVFRAPASFSDIPHLAFLSPVNALAIFSTLRFLHLPRLLFFTHTHPTEQQMSMPTSPVSELQPSKLRSYPFRSESSASNSTIQILGTNLEIGSFRRTTSQRVWGY